MKNYCFVFKDNSEPLNIITDVLNLDYNHLSYVNNTVTKELKSINYQIAFLLCSGISSTFFNLYRNQTNFSVFSFFVVLYC